MSRGIQYCHGECHRFRLNLPGFVTFAITMSARAPTPKTINEKSRYRSSHVPDVKLEKDLDLPYRVYVLKCAGKHSQDEYYWYVGIIEVALLATRILKHFSKGGGAAFTSAHRPLGIELVWPASTTAAEAYVC